MSVIGRRWAGHLFGTNTGKVSANLDVVDGAVSGELRLKDDDHGPAVLSVEGKFDGARIELVSKVVQASEGVTFGDIAIAGRLMPDGNIKGDWKSSLGTGGTFELFPHGDLDKAGEVPARELIPGLPERLHTATREVGAVRLSVDDVGALVQILSSAFPGQQPVVVFPHAGLETVRYAADFLQDAKSIGTLRGLRLNVQQADAYGNSRMAFVDLSPGGPNTIKVQGVDARWVRGLTEELTDRLRRHERRFVTGILRWGLNINTLGLAVALAALPDLTFTGRLAFLATVALIIWGVARLHRRFVPNAVIYLAEEKRSQLSTIATNAFTWVITIVGGFIAALAYGLLAGEVELPAALLELFR